MRTWTGPPSLSEVKGFVEDIFKQFQREDYELCSDKFTFISDDTWASWLGSKTDVTVQVRKSFERQLFPLVLGVPVPFFTFLHQVLC